MIKTRGHHLIGKVVGSCVLEKLLGYGGSSAVFLAQQHNPERQVAIKVFLPRTFITIQTQKDFYTRFLREAEAASKLDHPNILPIYAYGEQDGLPYIVMPYMPGGTLAEYMSQRGPLSLEEAEWYMEQIASALDYAHANHCVHCDVKPANMLLDSEGHVILSDFGIARLTQTEDEHPAHQNQEAVVMGTPDYISPEQSLGHAIDGRSDVYSLGIMLFYLLAKRPPFSADSAIALALAHINEPPPSLALLRADVTPAIDQVLYTALAKNPDDRFQTAGMFKTAFSEAVAFSALHTPSPASLPSVRVTYKPVVLVKPLWQLNRRLLTLPPRSRLLSITALLVLLISIVVGSTLYVRSQLFIPNAHTPLAKHVDSSAVDLLANRDDWPTGGGSFFYDDSSHYHIVNKSDKGGKVAYYGGFAFHNFHLSVTTAEAATSSKTADYYGVVFRSSSSQSHYYLFEVSALNAQYSFWRNDGKEPFSLLASGSTSTLLAPAGQSNTISIEAQGNTFTFYINDQQVGAPYVDTSQSLLTSGQIGLYVEDQSDIFFKSLYIENLK